MDLVPGVFPSENGYGYIGDVCAECLTKLQGGDGAGKKDQAQRRERGRLESLRFGDC